MTESSLLITPNAVPPDPTALSSSSALPPHSPSGLANGHITEDGDADENYTIKCICSFADDDGNTVICDKCETWQHLACYYQDGNAPGEEDSHFCVDCDPRKLDARTADDIQRRLRGSTPEEAQRKPKKPGPKPKKKKDHLGQVNGHANGHGSPRNGTEIHSKRPKARHQSSSSTTNIPLKLPAAISRRSASASHGPPGPVRSPNSPSISCDPNEAFSVEFMHLYETDTGSSRANVNEFDDISLTMTLGDWVRDEDILAQATNGKTKSEIFQRSLKPIQSDPYPLQIHTKVDKNITAHGKHPKWKFLTIEQDVSPSAFVGELHGKIGSMQQYTQDPANRWDHLRHPVPFVFFHPQLPIIIDTREEGSVFRHLRRSCVPNLTMKTVLEEEFDYHFVFSAMRDIEKGEELTIPWTLDEHTRRFFKNTTDCDVHDEYVMNYCRSVLAEFGGCACNETNCVMASWAGWNEPPRSKLAKGRKRSGRGLGSRSGSEALKQYDDDLDDGTAGSTSSHSKPQSRDNTPSSIIDSKNILGEPISEREKRKIAALERSEQDRQPEKKKQKRKSADNRSNSHNPPPTPGFGKRSYHEMFMKVSGSPVNENGYKSASRITASPLQGSATPPPPKPVYRESSCQTDIIAASPPRSVASPTRVLPRRAKNPLHRHVFRRSVLKSEGTSNEQISPVQETSPSPDIPQKPFPATSAPLTTLKKDDQGDVQMEDAAPTPVMTSVVDFIPAPAPETPQTKWEPGPVEAATDDASTEEYSPPPAESPIPPDNKEDLSSKSEMRIENMPPPSVALKVARSVETPPTIVESPAPLADTSSKALIPPTQALPEEKSPENKKKKMSLKEWSRRSSSNVPKNSNDIPTQEGNGDTKPILGPLKEDAAENAIEGTVVETPVVEKSDPMAL